MRSQQDGGTSHIVRQTMNLLRTVFGSHISSRFGNIIRLHGPLIFFCGGALALYPILANFCDLIITMTTNFDSRFIDNYLNGRLNWLSLDMKHAQLWLHIPCFQVRNCRPVIMQELEQALAQQAPPQPTEDPSLHELPPLMVDGIPTPVEKMTQVISAACWCLAFF